jgi:DNA-binding IclR family transcriptional regulator
MTSADKQIDKLSDGVRAVDRALDILLAFRQGDGSLTASDLLRRVDLSRPTLYRLLRTLEQRGFIAATGEPRRYQLGPSVGHLAHVWGQGQNLADLAEPVMQQLQEKTGETVALLLHRGHERVSIVELPSAQPLSFRRGIGHSDSVVVGASGRAILAFLPSPELYLEGHVAPARRPAYLEELARIRHAGYAISRDELIKGAVAVAVPLANARAQVIGSLAVYGPSARIDDELVRQYAAWLMEAAREIAPKIV